MARSEVVEQLEVVEAREEAQIPLLSLMSRVILPGIIRKNT